MWAPTRKNKAKGARALTRGKLSLLGVAASLLVSAACGIRTSTPDNAGAIPCLHAMDCPPSTTPCVVSTCYEERCLLVSAAVNTIAQQQNPGDCRMRVCDGNGAITEIDDEIDLPPDDANPCTQAACKSGAATHEPISVGEACEENGVCNGKGGCGVCLPGVVRCDGNAIASCDDEGQWGKETCPENRPLCSGKTCLGVKRISTGPSASCAHFDDNSVRCFGARGFRAEDGISQISSLLGATDIALGGSFGCVLRSGGVVSCWGANDFGQVGDGTKETPRSPTPVLGLSKALAIAAGEEFACAIIEGGKVNCWGHGDHGELGANPPNAKTTKPSAEDEDEDDQSPGGPPSLVPNLGNTSTVYFGSTFGCALFPGGRIGCFGNNDQNQLGGQVVFEGKPKPTPKPKPALVNIKGIEGATSIKLGKHHACVLLTDGTARCWGDNTHGQLGDGTTTSKTTPVVVKDLNNIQTLALGSHFSCAKLQDNTARCWGDNTHGQLGDGTTEQHPAPVPVSNLSTIQKLIAGGNHACAQLNDGTIKCWGGNSQNELGDRTTNDRTTPTPIVW